MWTHEDVEYALAWQELDADKCGGCGQPRGESFDPANQDQYDVRALVCHACYAREQAFRSYSDGDGSRTDGLHLIPKLTREAP